MPKRQDQRGAAAELGLSPKWYRRFLIGLPVLLCIGLVAWPAQAQVKRVVHQFTGPTAGCAPGSATVLNPSIAVNSGVATATFSIAAGCNHVTVSLANYEQFGPHTTVPETLFDSSTGSFGEGGPYTLTARVPNCTYEVDLVTGLPLQTFLANDYGDRLVTFQTGGSGSCEHVPPCKPTTVTVPVTTTIHDTTTATGPTTTVIQKVPTTVTTTVASPPVTVTATNNVTTTETVHETTTEKSPPPPPVTVTAAAPPAQTVTTATPVPPAQTVTNTVTVTHTKVIIKHVKPKPHKSKKPKKVRNTLIVTAHQHR